MKKFGGVLLLFLAAFLGVFAAFRFEKMISPRAENRPLFPVGANDILSVEPAGYQPNSVAGAPFDFRAASKKVTPSVVSVDQARANMWSGSNNLVPSGSGSGVILTADGYILTNNHVVEGGQQLTVRTSDSKSYNAKLIGRDPRTDLALLKVDGGSFVPAELGDSASVEVGQWVMAIGNPLGYSNTVSVGVVSSLGRSLEPGNGGALLTDAIQTDAAINSGNSGGALTDDRGRVIGINTAIATPSGGSVGIGFSIPINRAKQIVEELRKDGRVRYGLSGITPVRFPLADPGLREALKEEVNAEPPATGIVVSVVGQGSPAERAGIKSLDVLTKVDGKQVDDSTDLFRAMLSKRAGDKVTYTIWSRGKTSEVSVTLVEMAMRQ